MNTGQFKQEMKKSVLKEIIWTLAKVSLIFIVALLFASYLKNETTVSSSMKHIKETFIDSFEKNRSFLSDEKTRKLYTEIITENKSVDEFRNHFYRHNMGTNISSEVIIMDQNWKLKYSSYNSSEISAYHYSYNNAVSYNARNIGDDEVYTAVYDDSDGYYDFMMVKPIHDDKKEVIGYIALYMSGDDWSYYMSHFNFDGVITDSRNNIIFYNRPSLIKDSYKFNISKSKVTYIGENRYWLKYETLPEYGISIYSLVYYPQNPEIIIGLLVIMIIGLLWYNLANRISETMAEKNTQSISKLLSEIRIIRKYNQSHRIDMKTNDEFEDVAHQINNMLDNITNLNRRNTELLKLNNIIEINHLTAQINPHFLYNTLEIIRNLLIFDKDKAGKLIVQLTKVLRYSINNSKRDVILYEDMEFIKDYLFIQNTRFSDRLDVVIDIDENCGSCMVPKLVLQPLIENSIKYGFRDAMNLKIQIRGYRKGYFLYLEVLDNGPGLSTEEFRYLTQVLEKDCNDTNSNGLYNIHRRLKLQYGEKSGIEIMKNEDRGLCIRLKVLQSEDGSIPVDKTKEGEDV